MPPADLRSSFAQIVPDRRPQQIKERPGQDREVDDARDDIDQTTTGVALFGAGAGMRLFRLCGGRRGTLFGSAHGRGRQEQRDRATGGRRESRTELAPSFTSGTCELYHDPATETSRKPADRQGCASAVSCS